MDPQAAQQSEYNPFIKLRDTNGARQTCSRGQKAGSFFREQQRQSRNRQSQKKVSRQAANKRWKELHIPEHNLARASHSQGLISWRRLVGAARLVRGGKTQEAGWQVQIGRCWRHSWSRGVAYVKQRGVGKHRWQNGSCDSSSLWGKVMEVLKPTCWV